MRFDLGCCVVDVCKECGDLTFVGADVGEGILNWLVHALMALLAFLNLLGDFVESFADVAHFDFSDDGFDDGFDCLGGDDGLVVVVVVVVVIVIDDFATLGGRECCFVFFHCVVEEFASVDI